MRLIIILFSGLLWFQAAFSHADNPLDSNEALRARIKIKLSLDPLLAREKITIHQRGNHLVMVGQVTHPIYAEQALYLIEQSNVKADRIENALIIEKVPLSPEQEDELIKEAVNARILAAIKYQMQDIPMVGVNVNVNAGKVQIRSNANQKQNDNIKKAIEGISQIKSIEFLSPDKD